MLPKSNRLPHHQIRTVLSSRQNVTTGTLKLTYRTNGSGVTRFACIVPMSVDKRATMRNRIRRLVSESVHHVLSDIHTGYDIVILVRRNIAANKQKDVEKIVKSMLEKTHGLITPKT